MKKASKLMSVIMVLFIALLPMSSLTAYAAEDEIVVEINKENFPDDNFRQFLLDGYHYVWDEEGNQIMVVYDANDDGYLSKSEIANMKQLLIQQSPITDLTGVEYLTSLIEIGCQRSPIEKMELNTLSELLYLNCYNCNLQGTLDLTGNKNLQGVACHNNRNLTGLDTSGCAQISDIVCDNTAITKLDLSKNPLLKSISLSATEITQLDTSKNPELRQISAYNSKISSIDVSSNLKLESLDLDSTLITSLDVSQNKNLTHLNVNNTSLKYLNIGNNPQLSVFVSDCETTLEVPENSFDITQIIPGIDENKVNIVSGATKNGKTISDYSFDTPIVYTYDCGTSIDGKVTLSVTANLKKAADTTPTPTEPETDNTKGETKSPNTGDKTIPVLMLVSLFAAIAVLSIIKVRKES